MSGKRLAVFFVALLFLFPAAACAEDRPVIGVAWRNDDMEANYFFWEAIIWEAGGSAVALEPASIDGMQTASDGMLTPEQASLLRQHGWQASNVPNLMQNVDAVFFSGGEDISPSLLLTPQPSLNNGEPYCAVRDASDFLLMSYCLDNDVPLLAVCRGMQMLGVVSGAGLIQDIGTDGIHRMPDIPGRDYARHDVQVTDPDSHFGRITGTDMLQSVASWHHQAVTALENTPLKVTGVHTADGLCVIEAMERTDQTFALGVQFHPEVTCKRVLVDGADDPCDYQTCLRFVQQLVQMAQNP